MQQRQAEELTRLDDEENKRIKRLKRSQSSFNAQRAPSPVGGQVTGRVARAKPSGSSIIRSAIGRVMA